MVKIVVFDSGFGSLSVIKPIQKKFKSEIIYFADQKNYPYGLKTRSVLRNIIKQTIGFVDFRFSPDLIIVASNTPSLLFSDILSKRVIGIFPPLKKARQISKSRNIAILTTKNVSASKELDVFIKKNISTKHFHIKKINVSKLVELVESGKFLTDERYCSKVIKRELQDIKENTDTVTLSSTHLPFLKKLFEEQFPNVTFLDPAEDLAIKISKMKFKESKRNSLRVFSSGDIKKFERQLKLLKIKNKVSYLSA